MRSKFFKMAFSESFGDNSQTQMTIVFLKNSLLIGHSDIPFPLLKTSQYSIILSHEYLSQREISLKKNVGRLFEVKSERPKFLR